MDASVWLAFPQPALVNGKMAGRKAWKAKQFPPVLAAFATLHFPLSFPRNERGRILLSLFGSVRPSFLEQTFFFVRILYSVILEKSIAFSIFLKFFFTFFSFSAILFLR